ncbi:MAG: DNA polymerase/3'-5' exonuclease PolX [Candidatus Omnitrophica bacterium]|jgi:DNA polymerase (family 10)|nr:DNA polymerase/3'-5' exonuclease PolX [Candidatus Omnitrophota bacterium]
MKNQEVSRIFRDIAKILELKGENIFRIRAYERAAQAVDNLQENLEGVIKKEELTSIPGIGADLSVKIKEIAATGRLKYYEELKKKTPQGLIAMMEIPGLGPKTVKKLYEQLKINTVEKLEKAAKSGKLLKLEGIREKTEDNILRGINLVRKGGERQTLNSGLLLSKSFVDKLKSLKAIDDIEVAGSVRRKKDTIKDIDILVTSKKPKEVMDKFIHLDLVKEVLAHGETKSSVIAKENNMQVDLRVLKHESFGSALLYFTGSKEFNIRLRQLAIKMGYKINEYGVFPATSMKNTGGPASGGQKDKKLAGKTEEEIFSLLKMAYIPPELREDRGEIDAALENKLPKLIELNDIKGDFHIHSRYSDGLASIADIAKKLEEFDYEYAAICDHSQSLKIAGGLSEKEVYKKLKELKKVNQKSKIKLFAGTEVDIASDGTLDYSNNLLKEFDVVVAAIHSGFKQTKAQLTKRIVNACKNKYTNIIAHPTGKLWGAREAYDIDIDEICRAAADNQVALEINCYPQRLDLNDINVMRAKKHGVKLTLGTDSHQLNQLWSMELGVAVARRGWLEKGDIINCLSLNGVIKWLKK